MKGWQRAESDGKLKKPLRTKQGKQNGKTGKEKWGIRHFERVKRG